MLAKYSSLIAITPLSETGSDVAIVRAVFLSAIAYALKIGTTVLTHEVIDGFWVCFIMMRFPPRCSAFVGAEYTRLAIFIYRNRRTALLA
jgi:hypothetical protein